MSRFLFTSICFALTVGTLQVSFATQPLQQPVKKTAAPTKTGTLAARSTAPPARAIAPVAKTATPVNHAAAPAVASPSALQAVATGAGGRSPASVTGASSGSGNSKDISEELKIMGQSRNLSMGLLFQKDKDKLTFGTPRTNYEDKVSDKKANF